MANISGMASDAEINEAYEDYEYLTEHYRCRCCECAGDVYEFEEYYVELYLRTGKMIDENARPARREAPPVRALFAKNSRN